MPEIFGSVLGTAAAFVFTLSVVVFVHEFGHFQAARWSKIAIDTFSIGFGRTLVGWRDKQGVAWKIGMLPLGGYVKFQDDADAVSSAPAHAYDTDAAYQEARAKGLFHAQPVAKRAFVVAAGPVTNFIFAILAFAVVTMVIGRDVSDESAMSARLDMIMADSPADKAGLKPGDVVTAIAGRDVASFGALQAFVREHPGETADIVVQRAGESVTAAITIGSRKELDRTGIERELGMLGVQRQTAPGERQVERVGPIAALGSGAEQTWDIVASTGAYIGNIFAGKASAEHISGPIGIMKVSGTVAKSSYNSGQTIWTKLGNLAVGLLAWAATLSVAVGIVNLLPVPILDGGHLMFYAAEVVRGRPLSARAQELGMRAGFALILSLFLFATWNDLQPLKVLEYLAGMLS